MKTTTQISAEFWWRKKNKIKNAELGFLLNLGRKISPENKVFPGSSVLPNGSSDGEVRT